MFHWSQHVRASIPLFCNKEHLFDIILSYDEKYNELQVERLVAKSLFANFQLSMKESFKSAMKIFEPFRRLLISNGTYKQHSFENYVQFMMTKVFSLDLDSQNLSPSSLVDSIWHLHLLDEKDYKRYCIALCGAVIRHAPENQRDSAETRNSGEMKAEILHSTFFRYSVSTPTNSWNSFWVQKLHSKRKHQVILPSHFTNKPLMSKHILRFIGQALCLREIIYLDLTFRGVALASESLQDLQLSDDDVILVRDRSMRC